METEEIENHNVYELGVVSGKRDNKICFNYDPTRWTTYNRLEQEQGQRGSFLIDSDKLIFGGLVVSHWNKRMRRPRIASAPFSLRLLPFLNP